jgi:hypothetical protein
MVKQEKRQMERIVFAPARRMETVIVREALALKSVYQRASRMIRTALIT